MSLEQHRHPSEDGAAQAPAATPLEGGGGWGPALGSAERAAQGAALDANLRWHEEGLTPALLPTLRELSDLKRIRSAGRPGSLAARHFRTAWSALAAGADPAQVTLQTTAACLAAARLGDLDRDCLEALGLTPDEATATLARSIDAIANPLDPTLTARLKNQLTAPALPQATPPTFVARLAQQPRAGITCPGRPRVILEPAEDHAEHCLTVAIYGVLLSPAFAADPTQAFLAGLAHHLHSAAMPDSGFTGEVLLGDHLATAMATARAQAAAQLAPELRAAVETACAPLASDTAPHARAFHAADSIDRVLEVEHHLQAATLTMDSVLNTYELVHDGPVKSFHDRILAQVGLL